MQHLTRYEFDSALIGKLASFWKDEDFDTDAIKSDLMPEIAGGQYELKANAYGVVAGADARSYPDEYCII